MNNIKWSIKEDCDNTNKLKPYTLPTELITIISKTIDNSEKITNIKKTKLKQETNRLNLKQKLDWADGVADIIIKKFPNRKEYIVAAGISPSGDIHFGNFRDIMVTFDVFKSLESKGKKVKFIFSWDDYDRFRKVPVGIPEEFNQYIGMPLSSVPDPKGEYESYAKRFQVEFEEAIKKLDINLEYRYQTDEYKSGRYKKGIIEAINKKDIIAKQLLDSMSEKSKKEKGIVDNKFIEEFYPISVYSKFTGKDNTKIISHKGTKIKYLCLDTNKEDEIDIEKENGVKLNWKIDWPMRWKEENVVFEAGGEDHAAPGGSYDSSYEISRSIYDTQGPVFTGYSFIGIQGLDGKMSGSSGNAVPTSKLLDIYEPELLKYLYLKKSPKQSFNLAFNSEIIRQYDEFDKTIKKVLAGKGTDIEKNILKKAGVDLEKNSNNLPIRQAISFGQIVQFDLEKFKDFLRQIGTSYNENSIKSRLKLAKNWLETYNQDEKITLLESKNIDYYSNLGDEQKDNIKKLFDELVNNNISLEELNTIIYEIPKDENLEKKENSNKQKEFFTDIYNLLIGKDTGPRLSTFLISLDRKKVLDLLNFN